MMFLEALLLGTGLQESDVGCDEQRYLMGQQILERKGECLSESSMSHDSSTLLAVEILAKLPKSSPNKRHP